MSWADHQAFARDRVVVMAAPNGARRTRADHPALPMAPGELADEAAALLEASVSVLHLHVRDHTGAHTLDPGTYRSAMTAIRSRIGDRLVIQVTTEAAGRYRPEQQMAMVRELRPEAVSLSLNELCPDPGHEQGSAEFFAWLQRERIWPQYILYSSAELERFERLRNKGFFSDDRPFCMFVLGRYSDGIDGSAALLEEFLGTADCGSFPWAACCFGRLEQQAMLAALDHGGHVRLGFENNLWLPDGALAESNAHLVSAFIGAAANHGRRPASAGEIRELIL